MVPCWTDEQSHLLEQHLCTFLDTPGARWAFDQINLLAEAFAQPCEDARKPFCAGFLCVIAPAPDSDSG